MYSYYCVTAFKLVFFFFLTLLRVFEGILTSYKSLFFAVETKNQSLNLCANCKPC